MLKLSFLNEQISLLEFNKRITGFIYVGTPDGTLPIKNRAKAKKITIF